MCAIGGHLKPFGALRSHMELFWAICSYLEGLWGLGSPIIGTPISHFIGGSESVKKKNGVQGIIAMYNSFVHSGDGQTDGQTKRRMDKNGKILCRPAPLWFRKFFIFLQKRWKVTGQKEKMFLVDNNDKQCKDNFTLHSLSTQSY